MRTKSINTLILIGIVGFISHAWGFDFQEGRYEIISEIQMPGMKPPPVTITRCMTPQDPVPDQSAADPNCRVIDKDIQGNTVSWEVECDHEGQKMKGRGKMTYHGDRFEGNVETVMRGQDGDMKITTAIKGKRVGDCQ
jgi:hypothetical protein